MIKVLFFASFKETLGCSSTEIEFKNAPTVEILCETLSQNGAEWLELFGNPSGTLKVSINQEMADISSELKSGDEVAFFPPVTGG